MTDRPYTAATLLLVTEALASRKYSDSFEEDARHVLDELVEAGLLITPRIQQDAEWFGRAYIYNAPDGKRHVLNPVDVDVILPQGEVTERDISRSFLPTLTDPVQPIVSNIHPYQDEGTSP